MGERLAWSHQIEILIGREAKKIHHLGHHFTMLTGEHHPCCQSIAGLKGPDHRSQLDRLRASPQNDRDAGLIGHDIRPDSRILRASSQREARTTTCHVLQRTDPVHRFRKCDRGSAGFSTQLPAPFGITRGAIA